MSIGEYATVWDWRGVGSPFIAHALRPKNPVAIFRATLQPYIVLLTLVGSLLLFLTDNGYEQPPRRKVGFMGGDRGKTSIRELGFRTPIVAHWPGKIAAGRSSKGLVSSVDVFSTIADYAGVEVPKDRDGRSLRPFLDGGEEPSRQRIIVGNYDMSRLPDYVTAKTPDLGTKQNAYALRSKRWRYVWFMDADIEELYDIERDRTEDRNVIAQRPELAAQFRSELELWLESMRAPYVD